MKNFNLSFLLKHEKLYNFPTPSIFRGLDKALYYLNTKKYDFIIESCNEEIDENQSNEDQPSDENHLEMNGKNESEDEGISADDSQKDSLLNVGSGDHPLPDVR